MRTRGIACAAAAIAATLTAASVGFAQGTQADYERANALRARYESLVANVPGPIGWIGSTTRFWYRIASKGTVEFIMYDTALRQKRPAFDHEKLAAGLTKASGTTYTGTKLPFTTIAFSGDEKTIDVTVEGT